MTALIQITPWHWAGFILCVLIFLALDLGVFHRGPHTVKFREALAWSALWFALAMMFAAAMTFWRGREEATEFVTGYLIELSLSLDNILVIALIFAAFRVTAEFQHRILFWGILGALAAARRDDRHRRGACPKVRLGALCVRRFSCSLPE
jgi:tellurite resistance protein TerC